MASEMDNLMTEEVLQDDEDKDRHEHAGRKVTGKRINTARSKVVYITD